MSEAIVGNFPIVSGNANASLIYVYLERRQGVNVGNMLNGTIPTKFWIFYIVPVSTRSNIAFQPFIQLDNTLSTPLSSYTFKFYSMAATGISYSQYEFTISLSSGILSVDDWDEVFAIISLC